jgi:enoyl-[acyl-carrier protein] reductase/trans-2-enoyl-CoA reductase (NAD+)
VSIAFKIMKERGIHENPIEQANRLFRDRLYRADGVAPATDDEGRVRLDDWELRDAQDACKTIWPTVTTENLRQITDYYGCKHEFLQLFGFDRKDVDYGAEVEANRRFDCLEG